MLIVNLRRSTRGFYLRGSPSCSRALSTTSAVSYTQISSQIGTSYGTLIPDLYLQPPKRTPLYDFHTRPDHAAKMVTFAGYDMPLVYEGTGPAVAGGAGMLDAIPIS